MDLRRRTKGQQDQDQTIELVRACDEESVENGYTREKEERTTKNKMEGHVPTRLEKHWTEGGRGDGQGDME